MLRFSAWRRARGLERRLGLNSTDSSLPLSSDPSGTSRPRKKAKGRKEGAQKGHEAHRRELYASERVDEVIEHWPDECRGCGHRFALFEEVGGSERRQVIDLPRVCAHITEHRLHRCRCPACGTVSRAAAPAGVVGEITFGPN